MTDRKTYHATAKTSGTMFSVKVNDLPPGLVGITQGHTRDEAYAMAVEVIALLLEVPEDSFDVIITFTPEG